MNWQELTPKLFYVEKPARYIGNEIGSIRKKWTQEKIKICLIYPDTYEIGMSNLGIKILYQLLNRKRNIICERAFSPWPDMEKLLLKNQIPLFSLESRHALSEFDILAFSLQHELVFSNVFNILRMSNLPFNRRERNEHQPIILAGGPITANPLPFEEFMDIIFIGEAEQGIWDIVKGYQKWKKNDSCKNDFWQILFDIEGIYLPALKSKYRKENKKIKRRIFSNFHKEKQYPGSMIPFIKIVQDRDVIEIMRGCDNACRFCQAGIIYRPRRERNPGQILKQAEKILKKSGNQELSFLSLSSADYSQIAQLIQRFNEKFSKKNISCSLPSLKINSFLFEILSDLSSIRKSGLTFAVESANQDQRNKLNKEVDIEKMEQIIQKAKKSGWHLVKLYFMIGLSFDNLDEIKEIENFLKYLLYKIKGVNFNINISVFVPKPHTPFQWNKQLLPGIALAQFQDFKKNIKSRRIKISYHDPYESALEGLICRGDEKIGKVLLEAFQNGAKFDAWNDYFDFNYYQQALKKYNISLEDYLCEKTTGIDLPWDIIDIRVGKKYLVSQYEKSKHNSLSKGCQNCNVCQTGAKKNIIQRKKQNSPNKFRIKMTENNKKTGKIRFQFLKNNDMIFLSHMDVSRYFQRLFRRSNIPLYYNEGFNPKMKLEFASPLSLGISSDKEIAEVVLSKSISNKNFLNKIKANQHYDLKIVRAIYLPFTKTSLFKNLQYSDMSVKFLHKSHQCQMIAENWDQKPLFYEKNNKKQIIQDNSKLLQVKNNTIFFRVDHKSGTTPSLANILSAFNVNYSDVIVKRTALWQLVDNDLKYFI